MGIQTELLKIGGSIVAHEAVVPIDDGTARLRALWQNTRDFLPGLAILATFGERRVDPNNIRGIVFRLLGPDEVELTVTSDPKQADMYENSWDASLAAAFRQYGDLPESRRPVGTDEGLATQLLVVQPQQPDVRDLVIVEGALQVPKANLIFPGH